MFWMFLEPTVISLTSDFLPAAMSKHKQKLEESFVRTCSDGDMEYFAVSYTRTDDGPRIRLACHFKDRATSQSER
jgi:hypothetical protein